jgi:uncharacterized repeat protein (TIGR02543 family)
MTARTRLGPPLRLMFLVLLLVTAYSCGSKGGNDVAGPEYTVKVVLAGTGSGVVTSLPSAITCPGTCGPLDWTPGATVWVIAAPATGSTFAGWSGSCSGTADTCQFVVTGHMVVTATFNL